jgi:hypothetical protein
MGRERKLRKKACMIWCIPKVSCEEKQSVWGINGTEISQSYINVFHILGGIISWCVLVLLYHNSHWIPGPSVIETPVPVEISGVKPDLDSLLYQAVYVSQCNNRSGASYFCDVNKKLFLSDNRNM